MVVIVTLLDKRMALKSSLIIYSVLDIDATVSHGFDILCY